MSVTKKFLKSKPVCKVTLKVPKKVAQGANQVTVVGDFNDWDYQANPMKGLKDGSFSATLELSQGREYQFRYLIDGQKWENEQEADKSVPTPFPDATNSVLIV